MTNKNLLLSIAVAVSAVVTANAQTPFPTGVHVALSKPGMNSAAKVYTIYTSTNAASATFTPGVTFNPAYNINGIGLNLADNLLYGAAFTGQSNNISTAFNTSLFRIGSDGVPVDLGLLPITGAAGSGAMEFVNISAGTVSSNGNYYYMTYAIKPVSVARILGLIGMGQAPDLTADDMKMYFCWKSGISSLPSNPGGTISGGMTGYYELDFSNPDMTSAFNAFLTQVNNSWPNVFDADGGVQDLAINPVDNKIYAYISYPSGGTTVGRPVVMNPPVAGISSVVPVGTTVNTVPGQEAAGVQFDAAGNMYTLFTTGDYAQVNLTTGALMGLTPSNLATTSGNLRGDLASAFAPDLTPTLDMDDLNFAAAGDGRDFVVNLFNIGQATTGSTPIVFRINKLSSFTITYPTVSGSSNVYGGTPNTNSNWTFTETASFITVTAMPGINIAANGSAIIGFHVQRNASVPANTVQNITPAIIPGAGGEVRTNNNVVSTSITAN